MQCELTHHSGQSEARLSGQFTFHDNEVFRQMMNNVVGESPKTLVLKLSDLEYIDSSALGMLLLLRETLSEQTIALELHHPKNQVAKMFDISQFDGLFSITH